MLHETRNEANHPFTNSVMNSDKREVESVMRIYIREINADLRVGLERPPWGVKFSWSLKNEVRYLGGGSQVGGTMVHRRK